LSSRGEPWTSRPILRPEAYGALRPTKIELAETHISWAFLLDADVFKVKKPVALGFVDFRSIEQRKVACDAEVSTIADRVGLELSAPVIEADRTRKAILGVEATHPIDESVWQGAYDPAFTEKVYAEVLRRADVVLASGRPVVVDASFRSRAMRRAVQDLACRHHVPFRFIECRADPSVCRARLVARAGGRGVSDGRLEIFDAFRARFETVDELAPDDHVVLDTTRPLDENITALRARLDAWPPGLTG
jgi:predicted kinase